jgi:site-specific DNA recombinase
MLAVWAQPTGRHGAGQPCRGCLQFAFYRRVSTEGHQDPVTSLAWQREQAATLVAEQGRSSQNSPTSGRAGPWRGRAAALADRTCDPATRTLRAGTQDATAVTTDQHR